MLKNYLKISWRSLMKRKFYTLVTVFGLSVGITFSLLMGSYVWGESQVNTNLRDNDDQYMIQSRWSKENMGLEFTSLGPLAKALKENYPNLVENYYRFDGVTTVVSKGEKIFKEDVQIGDSTILGMYGFQLLYGDARTALNQPYTMVISAGMAQKYFSKTDVLGQSLRLASFSGEKRDFMIAGVVKDMPGNSVTNLVRINSGLPVLISVSSAAFFGRNGFDTWANPYIGSYIKLKNGVSGQDLEKPLAQLIATHAPAQISDNLHAYLKPLRDVYLEANNGVVKKTMRTLSLVAVFILLMAVVNFVNISIGNSSGRLKEIGVRKVLGGNRAQVLRQFLTESVIISFASLLVSLVMYEVSRPYFSSLLQKEILSLFDASPAFFASALGLGLLIGLLSGLYPSLVLAAIPSVDSMKGKLKSVKENVLFRRILLTSQFTVALFVFGGALVISEQVDYFFNKDLGYNKEAVFSVRTPRDWSPKGVAKMEILRNELTRLKDIKDGSLSWEIPDGATGFSSGIYRAGQDSTQAFYAPTLVTDENYAQTYGISLKAGKFFSEDNGTHQPDRMVLNESALKALGYKNPEMAVGQQVRVHAFQQTFTIAGVVKDFHFQSMHAPIGPVAFMQVQDNNFYRYLSFRLNPGNLGDAMANIEKKWKQLIPDTPFEYTFMDDTLHKMYQSELQMKQAAQLATVLALVIVLLGVLGMVSLNIVRRTREIGVRKVLGATGLSITWLFMKEFIIVVAFASLIAFPLALIGLRSWLQNYAYRINMSWVSFAFVGVTFALLVMALVGMQTLKAAGMNPVRSLKIE